MLPPDVPMAGWPAKLRIAIERLPQAAYVWDDADPDVTWDDTTPERVWDAPFVGAGFTDAVCDFHALTIESGVPDELGLFEAGRVELTLSNPDGEYTAYTVDGRLVYFAPGRQLSIWAQLDGVDWWLANVRIDRWNPQADGTVVVEASDGFSLLAREQGGYTPGVAAEKALARITAIATLAGFPDPVRGDTGDVTLTRQLTDRAPLEEIQTVALSDGGIVAVDADGTLLYRNRLWPAGRADQTTLDVFSDNVCTVPAVVWDLEWTAADDALTNWVKLVNVAGLTATATDPAALVRWPLTHPDPDQWTTQAEGDTLAAVLLAQRSTPRLAVESFTLHVHDPQQDLWRTAIDRRIGDRIRFISDQTEPGGGTSTLDIVAVVSTIRHEITPEAWVTTIGTTRSVDYVTVEEWDRTLWVWDDADPDARLEILTWPTRRSRSDRSPTSRRPDHRSGPTGPSRSSNYIAAVPTFFEADAAGGEGLSVGTNANYLIGTYTVPFTGTYLVIVSAFFSMTTVGATDVTMFGGVAGTGINPRGVGARLLNAGDGITLVDHSMAGLTAGSVAIQAIARCSVGGVLIGARNCTVIGLRKT